MCFRWDSTFTAEIPTVKVESSLKYGLNHKCVDIIGPKFVFAGSFFAMFLDEMQASVPSTEMLQQWPDKLICWKHQQAIDWLPHRLINPTCTCTHWVTIILQHYDQSPSRAHPTLHVVYGSWCQNTHQTWCRCQKIRSHTTAPPWMTQTNYALEAIVSGCSTHSAPPVYSMVVLTPASSWYLRAGTFQQTTHLVIGS